MTFQVYCRTNTITKKKYVGITGTSIDQRWQTMLDDVDQLLEKQRVRGRAPRELRNPTIYADIARLGRDCWEHEVLDVHDSIFFALVSERRWIKKLNTNNKTGGDGYNRSPGGELVLRCGGTFSIEDMITLTSEVMPYVLDDSLPLPVVESRINKQSHNLDDLVEFLTAR